ncbi:MAG: cytochrome b/b6 domain-containing protein [Pyrobaculum sp.]
MSNVKTVNEIEIISVGYRIAHQLNIVLFTILAITGSMLLFPDIFAALAYAIGAPLAAALGLPPVSVGLELARTSHRFLGFVWGVVLIVYGLNLLLFRKVEVFAPLKRPIAQQIREAKALVAHYLAGRPLPPDVENNLHRHNVLVSYLSILLLLGLVLLAVSGVLLTYAPALGLSSSAVSLLLLLHDIGFYFSLLFLLGHLFATTHISNRPLLNAMFGGGKVPLSWARRHMAKYLHERGIS